MDNKKTIIFMGGSGTGKGTQAEILKKKFEKRKEDVLYFSSGDCVRRFLTLNTITANLASELSPNGILSPDFLIFHFWADKMNKHYTQKEHLFIDGIPRNSIQTKVLEESLKFYNIEKPIVIYFNVSLKTLKERMLKRGRADDDEEKIANRLSWFGKDVKPILDYFKENNYYEYHEIDGKQNIEDIAKEIDKLIFN